MWNRAIIDNTVESEGQETAVALSLCDLESAARHLRGRIPISIRAMYDPEDFAGDALVEILERGITPDDPAKLLVTIARRRLTDAIRSPRSRTRLLEIDVIGPNESEAIEARDLETKILGMAQGRDREALKLKIEGESSRDAAERLGVGIRTVERIVQRMAKRLGMGADADKELQNGTARKLRLPPRPGISR